MSELELIEPWKELHELIKQQDSGALHERLEAYSSSQIARALTRLSQEDRHQLLLLLEPEKAADLIEDLVVAHGADIVEILPEAHAAAIIDEMESHHRADLLGEMDEEDAEKILQHMDPEEAKDARRLLEYEEDTAGGIMATEFVSFPQGASVGDVLSDLRQHYEIYSDFGIQYVYVETDKGTLVGVVRLRDLVLAPPKQKLSDLMIVNPIYVLDSTPLDELVGLFDRFTFWVVPVTDADGRLVGVARRADAEEALGEEHERTLLRFGGIIGGEELRSMPLRERASRRLAWLCLNVLLSIIAASVLVFFEATVSRVFALVFFIPIIANLSGCSGNQAVAVSIRELTLGLIKPGDFLRVWSKEFSVSVINGAAIGAALGIVALIMNAWLWHESPYIGLVIGFAFFFNSIVAVSLGGLIPLVLRRFNSDPALGAPPILTTLSDMSGFVLVLTLAALALHFGIL